MTIEQIQQKVDALDRDVTLQNLIAQANARYILYNTRENPENFPKYTIKDERLDILAFQYLSLGCRLIEKNEFRSGIPPLEKGASIIEHCHGSIEVNTRFGSYYGLISSLAYYVCFQYSKSYILINKIENTTQISRLISLFLRRNYESLLEEIQSMSVDEVYTDDYLRNLENLTLASIKIYEITIAKALNNFVRYFYSGDRTLLLSAKKSLNNLKEIAEIKQEPDIWWVIRLLLLITDGFAESSLWNSLGNYFNVREGLVRDYIQSLIYKRFGGIYELFITQRNALPKVVSDEIKGCVVSIPTSSGKTRIAEIAILNCLYKDKDAKVLFIAPFRSLAYEIENSMDEIFSNMRVTVSHLYGGSLFSKLDEKIIENSSVIVATPEKAKAMLRGNTDILKAIKLVIIDEGHLLGANKRLIVNEIFYEELRYYIQRNDGKFLLLSAVLPNAEELSHWLTSSPENVYKENWRPSDERLGVLEWDGEVVDLHWRSTDTERHSYNPRFIIREELPWKRNQRKPKYFPSNKNEAIASTAFRLRMFGPVLIFVGRKESVFVIAREYEKCLEVPNDFNYENHGDWKAFELACMESYGPECSWLHYAKMGILCHNADLLSDVRLPLERLMRKERPRVIIATSTLGQGVNLGVSTVIFSTLYQAGNLINTRDFWNIAGRAGRAFVDHEGKILVALDTHNKPSFKVAYERKLIANYYDKARIDKAQSGCLELIKALKHIASKNAINFPALIEIIADNNIAEIHYDTDGIEEILDWIDDGLLALHSINNEEGSNNFTWIDDYFRNSLAYIQAENDEGLTGEQVLGFIKARTQGIISKVGNDKKNWLSIIKSGIPLNSDLQIEERLPRVIELIQEYLDSEESLERKITLLGSLEDVLNDINVLKAGYLNNANVHAIRSHWINAVPISEFSDLEGAIETITHHYSFTLPWVLNGISKKLTLMEFEEEASIIEEISILVETGLPNLKSVKVYQAGIRSRSSAFELGELFEDELWDKGLIFYKQTLLDRKEDFKPLVSDSAKEWLDLLARYSKRDSIVFKDIPNFTFSDIHEHTNRLIAKNINGKQYLLSPDFEIMQEVGNDSDIDFSQVNRLNGVYFDYNPEDEVWEMNIYNPYLRFEG